jgi:Xaa-Pro aminopeptidase
LDQDNAALLGVDSVRFFGDECIGYQTHLLQNDGYYKNFIAYVIDNLNSDYRFFSLYPKTGPDYMQQRVFVDRIINRIPALQKQLCDVSGIVADMRRVKDEQEQNLMQKAVDITMAGYGGVVPHIKHGAYEYQIRAQVECVFAGKVARPSFPTIVGAGKNSTILHYLEGWDQLVDGDLVVIDSGAEYEYYAADLTRTYPVSGKFTERQKEIYNCVLDTQEYIAQKARPGLWLSHKDKPQESLNHMARAYLEKKGYAQYFPHGIGHFLGLDVHDVGDYSKPLQEGDVITIEPGIYIPQESLGVRIEDNYRLVSDGVVCLSGSLPKTVDAIEAMMLG